MKNILLLASVLTLASCASVDGVNKSPNCVVWKEQKYLGPYSVDVIENKIEWKGACTGYNTGCKEIQLTLDENKNILSTGELLGKVENNQLQFAPRHSISSVVNYVGVRAVPEEKAVKSSVIVNGETFEETYKTNDKCSVENAIQGAVALDLITKYQSKNKK